MGNDAATAEWLGVDADVEEAARQHSLDAAPAAESVGRYPYSISSNHGGRRVL